MKDINPGSLLVDIAHATFKKIRNRPKAVVRRAEKAARKAARRGETVSQPEEDTVMLSALKSKTVLFGILTSAWGIVQVFLQAGDFSREAVVSLVSGVIIIVLRAVTTIPLAQK